MAKRSGVQVRDAAIVAAEISKPGPRPDWYREWLGRLLREKRHKSAFTRAITKDRHPAFMPATKHAAAYAIGLPVQPTMDVTPPEYKAAPVVAILAALGDPQARALVAQHPELGARTRMLDAVEVEGIVVD